MRETKKTVLSNKGMYYIYISLWVLYFLQGTLYESGSSISQAFLALALLLSIIAMVDVNYKNNVKYGLPKYIVAVNMMIVMVTIYGVILWIFGWKASTQWNIFLKEYYYSLLPIYTFYLFAKKKVIQQKEIKIFTVLFIVVTILFYFKQYNEASETFSREEITNNSGYMFVPLLALLPMITVKQIYKYIILFVTGAYVLHAAKRGAIVVFSICTFEYLFFLVKNSSFNKKIFTLALGVCIIVAGYQISMQIIENDPYLSSRLEDTLEGNSSSRDLIYNKLINNMKNETSLVNLLFGYGADGTRKIAGRLAHNDWLEIYTDMGLVGFLIYLYYWLCLFRMRKYIKDAGILQSFYIIMTFCFMRSLFSMSINDMYIVTTFIIGYIAAQSKYDRALQMRYIKDE